MYKILFCDLLLQKGNRNIDNHMIKILSEDHQVYVFADNNFDIMSLKNDSNVYFLENKYDDNHGCSLHYYKRVLQRTKLMAKYIDDINPDIVYISVYHTNLFYFSLPFLKKYLPRIVILENYNIDFLSSSIDRFFYNKYKNVVNHMVYEPYFKEYLCREIGVRPNMVHIVPHIHYSQSLVADLQEPLDEMYDCVSLSWSIDENVVNDIIEFEKKEHFFEKNNITCFIKSSSHKYESAYLTVKGGFIEKTVYDNLYKNSKIVLIPFPLSYKYRMSGCVVDSFSQHKAVVSTNFMLAEYYHSKYGKIICPCLDVKSMMESIRYYLNNIKIQASDFMQFELDHGYDAVKKSLYEMITKIQKNDNY